MLRDYVKGKDIVIIGTGVGQKSSKEKFYYANHHSNCQWNVLNKLKWINKIPQDINDFKNIMKESKFGFTDLVKDYSGSDNKVLTKYFNLINGKIKIDPKYLINKEQLEIDKQMIIKKIKRTKYIILNGKPITKILLGKNNFEYGLIEDKTLLESVGIINSTVLFSRNSVVRNNNKRGEIENKLVDLYSKLKYKIN